MSDGLVAEGARLEVNTGTAAVPVWTPVLERTQINVSKTGAEINMTSFDDEGFENMRPGLRGSTVDAEGNFIPTDPGYELLEDIWSGGKTVPGVRILWVSDPDADPPHTYVGDQWDSAFVTNLGPGGQVGDKVTLSLALRLNKKPTRLTGITL